MTETETKRKTTLDIETPGPNLHVASDDEWDASHVNTRSSYSTHYQSSHADDAEFFDDNDMMMNNDTDNYVPEATENTDADDMDMEAHKASSVITAATHTSSSLGLQDTLSPLQDCTAYGGRTSHSAAFSMATSELDSTNRGSNNDLDSSMYNRLQAAAMEENCERKAQLCFGSCCDLIKGSIITNVVQILFAFLVIVIVFPNENLMEIVEESLSGADIKDAYIIQGVSIVVSVVAIFGAIRFYKYPVLLGGLYNIIQCIMSIVDMRIATPIIFVLFAYPNIHLFFALHSGAITKENYRKTERYCCFGKRKSDDGCDCD